MGKNTKDPQLILCATNYQNKILIILIYNIIRLGCLLNSSSMCFSNHALKIKLFMMATAEISYNCVKK